MLANKKEYFEGHSLLISGLLWGITCFSIMEIIIPWRQKTEIDWDHIFNINSTHLAHCRYDLWVCHERFL